MYHSIEYHMDRTKVDVTKIDVTKMDLAFWSGQLSYDDYMYFNMSPGLPTRTDIAILENKKRVDSAFWARQLSLDKMISLHHWYETPKQDTFARTLIELSNRPMNELLSFLKDNNASIAPKVDIFMFNRLGELVKREQLQIDIFDAQPPIPDLIFNRSR